VHAGGGWVGWWRGGVGEWRGGWSVNGWLDNHLVHADGVLLRCLLCHLSDSLLCAHSCRSLVEFLDVNEENDCLIAIAEQHITAVSLIACGPNCAVLLSPEARDWESVRC
jgi:hypothetical protein